MPIIHHDFFWKLPTLTAHILKTGSTHLATSIDSSRLKKEKKKKEKSGQKLYSVFHLSYNHKTFRPYADTVNSMLGKLLLN